MHNVKFTCGLFGSMLLYEIFVQVEC